MKPLSVPYTILSVDSSATAASCALLRVEENKQTLLCESTVNVKLTHSQTLLPMVTDMLKNAGIPLDSVDALAVSVGPGSFTGIRIGVAAVKGLAFTNDLPCVGVSTLEAMAARFEGMPFSGYILTAMDARCQQIYTALFRIEKGVITRVTPDDALPILQVGEQLKTYTEPIVVVGDGARLCYETLKDTILTLQLAPVGLDFQHAVGVARVAINQIAAGNTVCGDELLPIYLRLPQAERELKAKQQNQT